MAERSLNKAQLIGRIGRDAETSHTPSGVAVSKFSVATSRSWANKESGEVTDDTQWHNVVVWRREGLAQYLTKGKRVYVEGRIETRSWEKDGVKRYSTEIIAEEILLLGGRGESVPQNGPEVPEGDAGIPDDDVPF